MLLVKLELTGVTHADVAIIKQAHWMPNTQARQDHNVSKLKPNHSPVRHDEEAGTLDAKHPGASLLE